jgi:hypothetical protein
LKGPVGTIVVVVPLPFLEFPAQIHIILVREELIKFLLVRPVGPFNFAVELWRSGFDVDMPDPPVLDMPMELRLELMTPICTNRVDAKWELVDRVVNEFDGVCLIVTVVDPEGSHARGVIDGRVLKAPDSMPLGGLEAHNLHVCLDMMAWDLLGVSVRVNGSSTYMSR